MQWDLEGTRITGKYLGQHDFSGVVTLSRIAQGGEVIHYVTLDHPIKAFRSAREKIIVTMWEIDTPN